MSWTAVAKKDFQDSIRVRWFWALTALFVIFAGGAAYLYAEVLPGQQETTVLGFIGILSGATTTLVPLIGLLLGYKAIAGERETGSLKLLLGLPHTRGEVVAGKLVGRSIVVSVAIVVGYLAAVVVGLVLFAQFAVVDFLLFTALTVLLAFAYIGISLGLSTATASTSRAGALAIGFWLVFEFLWGILVLVLVWAANGFSLQDLSFPEWAQFLSVLPPTASFSNANGFIADALNNGGGGGGGGVTIGLGAGAPGSQPWFTEPWFGLVVLLFWLVVPVALGYLRFRGSDL
jgi:ABC-2 type transport system permease protein